MEDREDRITRSAEVPAPPDRVWEALTEAGEVSTWFGAEAGGDIEVGGRIRFRWEDGRERVAVMEELDRPRRLSFRWLPFERYPDGETRVLGPGRIEIGLEPLPEGTRITVIEEGPGRPTAGLRGRTVQEAIR
jgi:uncharacterized protein YndB with AHSA1/START domain